MNIQGLTLMMAVMVYAAPLDNEDRLKAIIDSANSLKNMSNDMEAIEVPQLTKPPGRCVKEFFCLAEKALNKTIPKIHNKAMKKEAHTLNKELHVYNENSSISCSLDKDNGEYTLVTFLDLVVRCSEIKCRS